jgi:hypothetical protein
LAWRFSSVVSPNDRLVAPFVIAGPDERQLKQADTTPAAALEAWPGRVRVATSDQGQDRGEVDQAPRACVIASRPPAGVIAVLLPPARVASRRLRVAGRVGRDRTAVQAGGTARAIRRRPPGRIVAPSAVRSEPTTGSLARDAGPSRWVPRSRRPGGHAAVHLGPGRPGWVRVVIGGVRPSRSQPSVSSGGRVPVALPAADATEIAATDRGSRASARRAGWSGRTQCAVPLWGQTCDDDADDPRSSSLPPTTVSAASRRSGMPKPPIADAAVVTRTRPSSSRIKALECRRHLRPSRRAPSSGSSACPARQDRPSAADRRAHADERHCDGPRRGTPPLSTP